MAIIARARFFYKGHLTGEEDVVTKEVAHHQSNEQRWVVCHRHEHEHQRKLINKIKGDQLDSLLDR